MPRDTERQVVCCAWCGSFLVADGTWAQPAVARPAGVGRPTTHGICPTCFERERAKMLAQLEFRQKISA
jgi:hypothetical protein